MQLRDLYNIALTKNDEALTDEQVEAVFQLTCLTFFGEVKPKFEVSLVDKDLDDAIDELKEKIGEFQIIETITNYDNTSATIRVTPLNYNNFDLPIDYQGAFIELAEYFITSQTIKNINWFRNVGIQDVALVIPDIQQIKDDLRRRFNTWAGNSIMME